MIVCPKCKTKNLNSNKICDECGTPIEDQSKKIQDESTSVFTEIKNQLNTLNDKIKLIEINTRNNDSNSTVITDINMSFGSMVVFMVKWAIASIPAAIILFIIGMLLSAIFGGLFAALLR